MNFIIIEKIMLSLLVLQETEVKDALNKSYTKRKLNPYNPLSYLYILIISIIGFIMFGVVGFWKEVDTSNPFKWQ